MKKSDLFKQERAQKRGRLQEMQKAAETESRDYSEDETKEIDTLLSEIRALDDKIARAEAMEEQARQAAAGAGAPSGGGLGKEQERDLKKFSFVRFMRGAVAGRSLDGIEAEMQQEAEKEMRDAGQVSAPDAYGIPMVLLNQRFAPSAHKRDMTAGTDTAGGFTVPTSVEGYVEALRERTVLLSNGAEMLGGLSGNMRMPRENAVFNPTWEGETDAAAEQSPTYADVTFTPKRLAGYVDMSNQLLAQNAVSVEARIARQILEGHAIALDKAGFNGTGADNQPLGILNDGSVTIIEIGANGGAVTDGVILDLEEAVDLANGDLNPAMYVMTPKVRRALKGTALDSGSGLFLWDRLTNTVNSYSATSSNTLPANLAKGSGTNLNSMVFGDLSACSFGQWGGIEITRDNLTQALNGKTRMVLNVYNDFHVLQPGKIAACKDIEV